jgi:hypothetical protein
MAASAADPRKAVVVFRWPDWFFQPLRPASRSSSAGLRREEVAQLAAISVDYYTLLAQGRVHAVLTAEPGTPSHDALRILASWASADTERPDPAQQKDPNR